MPLSLIPALKKALEAAGPRLPARPVVVLGVGSELRGDDAAGIQVAERLGSLNLPGVHALAGGTAPENLTGEIRQLSPSHLVIVDSADMGEPPGATRVVDPEKIAGVSFGTHALPLSVLAGYLEKETGCRVIILGIQPRSLDFDAGLSAEVERAVEETVQALSATLRRR